jgi:hypothetical protein
MRKIPWKQKERKADRPPPKKSAKSANSENADPAKPIDLENRGQTLSDVLTIDVAHIAISCSSESAHDLGFD